MNGGQSPYFIKSPSGNDATDGINERSLKKCVEKNLKEAKKEEEARAFPAPAVDTRSAEYLRAWGKNDTREGFAGAISYQYPFNGQLDL